SRCSASRSTAWTSRDRGAWRSPGRASGRRWSASARPSAARDRLVERGARVGDASSMRAPRGPVLVTGGAGFVGSHAVRHLEALGVELVVLDNLSTGHREATRSPLEVVDLADREGLAQVFARRRPEAVLHFAAKCYVGESVQDPSKYYRENVI